MKDPEDLKRIIEIRQTCIACPEQYEGTLDSGEGLYIRIRWGCATLDINGQLVAEINYPDDPYLGSFEDGELNKLIIKAGIIPPELL